MNEWRLAGHIDLAPQPSNMDVDEVCARIEMIMPDLLEEHGSSDNLVMVPHEMLEQAQLPRLQFEVSRSAARFARQKIHFQIAYSQEGHSRVGRATQERINTRVELGESKRLGQIVVAASAQAAHTVFHLT
jgi:hypothetical protein